MRVKQTVLLTYEFGAGLGHLLRLFAVARRLGEYRLVFAVPDLALGEPAVRHAFGEAAQVVPGVVWPAPTDPRVRQVPTRSLADVMTLFGFGDSKRLRAALTRAQALLDETAPDLIVADFAPTLRLASQGRVPTVVVGNGYTVPPPGRPLPPMRPWDERVGPVSRAAEGHLLAAVNEARAGIGGEAVDHFADLFSGEHHFVCTISEFDPYGAMRDEPPVWPFNMPDVAPGPAVAARRGAPVFCYLQSDHPALDAVLSALSRLPVRSTAYIQGIDPHAVAARCKSNVAIRRDPADFAELLPRTRVLVHHAGLGTACAGLLSGTPQLLLPFNLEHAITARGVGRFGSGVWMWATPAPAPDLIARQIRGLLGDGALHARAARTAAELTERRVADPVAPIVSACRDLL